MCDQVPKPLMIQQNKWIYLDYGLWPPVVFFSVQNI